MNLPTKGTVVKLCAAIGLPLLAWLTPPRAFGFILPTLSPFLGFASALTLRGGGSALLLALPMTALILWKRRFFCRHACTVGWLCEVCERISPAPMRRYGCVPRIGRWAVLLTFGGALIAVPFFLWLDPLALYAGAVDAKAHWAYGLGFVGVLASSFLFPGLWCRRLCPLGAFQDLSADLKALAGRRRSAAFGLNRSPGHVPRRLFLGVCGGAAAASFMNRLSLADAPPPLRPPGAADEKTLGALCIRCGSCIRACPEAVLSPDLTPPRLSGLLLPTVRFDNGHCLDDCARCGEACPSGAIARLSVAAKNERKIGLAVVEHQVCLLAREVECGLCSAMCKRGAVVEAFSRERYTALIQIDSKRCNGCGACLTICPPKAISIVPALLD